MGTFSRKRVVRIGSALGVLRRGVDKTVAKAAYDVQNWIIAEAENAPAEVTPLDR